MSSLLCLLWTFLSKAPSPFHLVCAHSSTLNQSPSPVSSQGFLIRQRWWMERKRKCSKWGSHQALVCVYLDAHHCNFSFFAFKDALFEQTLRVNWLDICLCEAAFLVNDRHMQLDGISKSIHTIMPRWTHWGLKRKTGSFGDCSTGHFERKRAEKGEKMVDEQTHSLG